MTSGDQHSLLKYRSPSCRRSLEDVCRICLQGQSVSQQLVSPCRCRGTVGFVHSNCLSSWTERTHSQRCFLCRQQYQRRVRRILSRAEWPEALWRRFKFLREVETVSEIRGPFLVSITVMLCLYACMCCIVHRFENHIHQIIFLLSSKDSIPALLTYLTIALLSLFLGLAFHFLSLTLALVADFLLSDATVEYEYITASKE